MQSVDKAIRKAAIWLALAGGLGIVAMLIHICADIIVRQTLNYALPATIEIVSRYYMVATAFLPLALVERDGRMISVEILTGVLTGWWARLSDMIVLGFCSVVYAVLFYSSLFAALAQFRNKAFVMSMSVQIPTWPTYFIMPVAFLLAALVTVMRLIEVAVGYKAPGAVDGLGSDHTSIEGS